MRDKNQVVLPINLGICIPEGDFVFKVAKICEELDYTELWATYALVWNVDNYYVIGYNEKYGKAIKYRVDKMCKLNVEDKERVPLPEDFDLSEYVESMFLMYGEHKADVTLRCNYSVIGKVIDRFGNDITINPVSDEEFEITETLAVGSTFFSWLFNYAGKIKIVAPEEVKSEFLAMIKNFDENEEIDEYLGTLGGVL